MQSAPNGCFITAQYLGQRYCWLCGSAGAHQEVEGALRPPGGVRRFGPCSNPEPPPNWTTALRSDRSYLGKHAGGTASASTLGGRWALFHAELHNTNTNTPFSSPFSFCRRYLAALHDLLFVGISVVVAAERMKEVCQCSSEGSD